MTATYSRQQSLGDQVITFPDTVNSRTDFEQLQRLLEASLDTQDKQCLADLREYVIKREDSWILDVKLLNFIGALLEHRSANLLYCIVMFKMSYCIRYITRPCQFAPLHACLGHSMQISVQN